MTLETRIGLLPDSQVLGLLLRFARAQPKVDVPATIDAKLAERLRDQCGFEAAEISHSSDVELARAALMVIVSNSEHRAGVESMLNRREGEKFALVESALVVSAVLIALQTNVRFERDKRGKWEVKIEKKPTDSSLLRDLVKKLLSFG